MHDGSRILRTQHLCQWRLCSPFRLRQ